MKRSIAALFVLLALSCAAHALGLGLGNRFGKLGAMGKSGTGGGGGSNFLLTNTGSVLLVNAGSKFLIQ